MSDVTRSGKAGAYVVPARHRAADNWDFIMAKHMAGVPVSAIARMSGCSVDSVREIVRLEGQAHPTRIAYRPNAELGPVEAAEPPAKKPSAPIRRGMPPKARRIAATVARKYGVSLGTLISKHDRRGLASARNEAWYLLRFYTDASLPMIAAWFERDHTTILYGLQRHEDVLLAQSDLLSRNPLGDGSQEAAA